MLAAFLLAAAAAATPSLGIWPETSGPAATKVDDVEFYLTEPEEEYWILAIEPLSRSLEKADSEEMQRLAKLAGKLGADAVILLGELPEKAIPQDLGDALPPTSRIGMAAFVTFECACEDGGKQSRHARLALPAPPRRSAAPPVSSR